MRFNAVNVEIGAQSTFALRYQSNPMYQLSVRNAERTKAYSSTHCELLESGFLLGLQASKHNRGLESQHSTGESKLDTGVFLKM